MEQVFKEVDRWGDFIETKKKEKKHKEKWRIEKRSIMV